MTIKTPTKLGLAAAAMALALTGCGNVDKDSQTSDGAGDGIETIKAGTLTVCTNPPYAPFEDLDGDQVVGFDMDLTAEVAKDLGLEIEFVEAPFESIESAASFDTGSCDVGASALTITADRAAKMDFSDPYYETAMGLLVNKDSGIDNIDGLTDKPVGVQQGTTGEEWAREQPQLTQIKQFETLGDQVTALKAGEVAGIINDEPTLTPYVDETFQLAAGFEEGGESFGFAVKQGSTALLKQINDTLARVKSDGTYETLIEKWFFTATAGE
ncbi:MAG: transporter substrate-binding domain-containing protein [Bifidobacteriaceae bacterium]|jgi:polar amino acid transport system substrate-binding protein|nr:transporter substrate-binding domain-containing protein [Bifidobacteriaceae bacterium]